MAYAQLVSVDTPEQLEGFRRAGRVVAATLRALRLAARPGVTTLELDRVGRGGVRGARCAVGAGILTYKTIRGRYVSASRTRSCTACPGRAAFAPGQLITFDVAAELDGYHADAAITTGVGVIDPPRRRLIAAARAALRAGIDAAVPGALLRDVGGAIEREAQGRGFQIVPNLTGHGIGRAMHEEPTVYNWAAPSATLRLTPGLVFTIEPMIVAGSPRIKPQRDGWT